MFYYKKGSTYTASPTEIAGAEEVSQAEYERIRAIVNQRPIPPAGHGYRLTDEMAWELYELPEESELELTEAEAMSIIIYGELS